MYTLLRSDQSCEIIRFVRISHVKALRASCGARRLHVHGYGHWQMCMLHGLRLCYNCMHVPGFLVICTATGMPCMRDRAYKHELSTGIGNMQTSQSVTYLEPRSIATRLSSLVTNQLHCCPCPSQPLIRGCHSRKQKTSLVFTGPSISNQSATASHC